MTTPLFLDRVHKPTFQKIAMPVKLSESPEAWQRDIAGEIYKQLPFLGEYAVNVILDRVDAQRGYGFGSAHVSNRSDSPLPDRAEQPSIRIPVIVRDYLMAPLDIFMDGAGVYPLTESRVREKLFRPETFELSTRKPADKGLVDQLYPPMRSNYGMGSLGGDTLGMGKAAADAEAGRRAMLARMHGEASANKTHIAGMKCASLVEAIAPTISERDADEFVDQITSDMEIKVAAARNAAFTQLAVKIAGAPRTGVEKTAAALVSSIKPTVVQLEKLASGDFKVKWANSQAFNPQQMQVGPQEASSMAGADLSGMQPGQTVTLSSEKAQKQSLDEPVYVKVDKFGRYEVQDMDSNQTYQGWVIPIVDLEMHPLELYCFVKPFQPQTGSDQAGVAAPGSPTMPTPTQAPDAGAPGAAPAAPAAAQHDPDKGIKLAEFVPGQDTPAQPGVWAVQDEIAGLPFGGDGEQAHFDLVEPNEGAQPQGSGMFFSYKGSCCVLPMTIQNGGMSPDGQQTFMGETMFGEPVTIQMVDGITAVQELGEGTYAIPSDLVWVPLPGDPVFLAKDPLDIESTDEAQGMANQVQIGSTGPGEFSMEGAPLAKVARDQRQFIKHADAEFLLVAMGVNPFEAKAFLKQAEKGYKVKCAGRQIVSLASVHADMTKKAAKQLADFPYHWRQNLVKEASVIDDADTADKVLSMNFVNPENITTFAKYLPELDEASQKLAELLLGVRLGVGSIDEGAVERAMKGMEVVIEGLKLLQQKAVA